MWNVYLKKSIIFQNIHNQKNFLGRLKKYFFVNNFPKIKAKK